MDPNAASSGGDISLDIIDDAVSPGAPGLSILVGEAAKDFFGAFRIWQHRMTRNEHIKKEPSH